MALPKPTIVIVPGAFHSPPHYGELIAQLHQAEWPTMCLALPSLNPSNPHNADVAGDSAFVRERMLLPLLEAGKDVLLVMHSYGGIPGSCAAKGLSKSERSSQGHTAGIFGIVYIAAILVGESKYLWERGEKRPNAWMVADVCLTVKSFVLGLQFNPIQRLAMRYIIQSLTYYYDTMWAV